MFFAAFVTLLLRTASLFLPQQDDPAVPTYAFFLLNPLQWIAASLAAGVVVPGFVFAACAAVAALLFGRVFCGWICPLGTVLDVVDHLCIANKKRWTPGHRDDRTTGQSDTGPTGQKDTRTKRQPVVSTGSAATLRSFKYCLLIVLLLLALLGIQAAGWLDPISVVTRTFSLSFFPALDFYAKALKAWGILPHDWYEFARDRLGMADIRPIFFLGQTLFFLIFVFICALSLVQKKFWCRNLCPLGALLGTLSSFRLMRIEIRISPCKSGTTSAGGTCTGCGRCVASCKMGAIVTIGAEQHASPVGLSPNHSGDLNAWKPADILNQECIHCQTCVSICPASAVRLRFGKPKRSPVPVLPGRRGFIASVLTSLVALPLLKRNPFLNRDREGRLEAVVGFRPVLRPPGAHGLLRPDGSNTYTDAEFLAKCIRCGSCMKVCPNNALHPALFEAGPAGLWAPMLVPRIGYCEYDCVDCTRVCPTGALQRLDEQTKKLVRIGTAFVDKERCIPWVEGRPCAKCEEFCPLGEKAIRMQEVELISGPRKGKTVFAPFVVSDLCIGCGYCENACPVEGRAGIRVSPPQRKAIQEF